MLSKYEPVVLAILALGASIMMENHHRIDMTQSDLPDGARPAAVAFCPPGPAGQRGPRIGLANAFAAEGQSTLLAFGGRDDVADACAASERTLSSAGFDRD